MSHMMAQSFDQNMDGVHHITKSLTSVRQRIGEAISTSHMQHIQQYTVTNAQPFDLNYISDLRYYDVNVVMNNRLLQVHKP